MGLCQEEDNEADESKPEQYLLGCYFYGDFYVYVYYTGLQQPFNLNFNNHRHNRAGVHSNFNHERCGNKQVYIHKNHNFHHSVWFNYDKHRHFHHSVYLSHNKHRCFNPDIYYHRSSGSH
jgi:hypothetical protein